MSSFGQWYEEQKAGEDGGGGSSSWFDSEQVLPLFNTEGMQSFSFETMKQSMEAQMPKKILGMGYQQRFKVSRSLVWNNNFASSVSDQLYCLGILCVAVSVGALLCVGIFCWVTHDCVETTKVCVILHLRVHDIYGELWNYERSL
jgi:hypothetical protein